MTISDCVRKAITGHWRTPNEIQHFVRTMHPAHADCSGSTITARLRELRGVKFGRYTVAKQRLDNGKYEYRLGK